MLSKSHHARSNGLSFFLQAALNLGRSGLLVASALLVFPTTVRALDPTKSIFQFNCQNWTRIASLPADKISAITQTDDGYIWLGGQNGLIRFDGLEFKLVPVKLPAAQGQDIQRMSLGRDGRLWFSIAAGGYGSYDRGNFAPIGDERWTTPGLNSNTILAARDGSIWTGSALGWSRWVKGDRQATMFNEKPDNVSALFEDAAGRVWLGTVQGGLYYWEEGIVKRFPDGELDKYTIGSLAQDSAGDLWVGTVKGIFRYDSQFHRKEILLPGAQINALLVDRHGIVWAGTDLGLGRYQHGKFALLAKADGLGSDAVTSLFEDAEGSLWVGTVEGLSQLTDLKFPIYSSKEGLVRDGVLAVTPSRRGGLWIGATSGISYFNDRKAVNYSDPALLGNIYIRRIFEAKNGDLFFCDGVKGMGVLRDGKVIAALKDEQWPEAFAEDATGVVVAIGPTLNRYHDGRLEPFEFTGEKPKLDWFTGMCVAKDGAIWAGTHGGLLRIKDGRVRRWLMADGLPSDRVHYVLEDVDGSIWGGTPSGLVRIKDDKVTAITAADGLFDSRIYSIVPDDLGYFWLASGHGILRIARKNLTDFAEGKTPRIECETFEGLESVKFIDRIDQGYSACKTLDGRIWFPNPHGVVMIDPAHYVANTVPPRVHVEKIRVDGRDLIGEKSVSLEVGARNVEVFFAALSFIAPKKVQIRYQLEGFDSAWINAGVHRSVVYNKLPHGRYTFHVQAANADGVWNTTGDSLSIELPPPYYMTFWFYSVCGLALGGSLYAAVRWKLRLIQVHEHQLRAQNDALEVRVGQRTAELANSLSLLQATLDSTADGILAIQFSGEVVSYNQQFIDMWRIPADRMKTADDAVVQAFTVTQVKDPEGFLARIREIHQNAETESFDVIEFKDGRMIERYCRPQKLDGETVGIVINFRDITARKAAEAKLEDIHKRLLETSRQAGMAEVATSVLHNVGNVLNSVNVSATIVSDQMRDSKAQFVAKVAAMLRSNEDDLARFLTSDPKGKMIPAYLATLAGDLQTEQTTMSEELGHLCKNIEHIKEIVAMQQSFAKVSGVAETIPLTELVDDALRINSSALERHEVELTRDYQVRPTVTIERHKLMQILVNLIRNAKYACDESRRKDKKLIVRISPCGERVRIAVIDNGVGIPKENLTRIFGHGFTTRKDGHGFGLHSGALVAKELGGSLVAESAGPGMGATFTIELPLKTDQPESSADQILQPSAAATEAWHSP